MIEINGVRGFLTPGDVVFLFNLAAELPTAGNYLKVGSWMGLSSILVANGLIANLNFDARIYCVDVPDCINNSAAIILDVNDRSLLAQFRQLRRCLRSFLRSNSC